ncbi:MAG: hypothetical protein ABIJ59_19100 [Pseudomonadota bacterium]
MGRKVILVSKETDELEQIHQLLSKNNYACHCIEKTDQIGKTLESITSNCIIFDLDSIDVDNRTIRDLTIAYPSVYFLCMSKDRFHPELKDAICYHIYACLTKPIDYDELLYWLRCIDNELDSGPSNFNNESE